MYRLIFEDVGGLNADLDTFPDRLCMGSKWTFLNLKSTIKGERV